MKHSNVGSPSQFNILLAVLRNLMPLYLYTHILFVQLLLRVIIIETANIALYSSPNSEKNRTSVSRIRVRFTHDIIYKKRQ